jgi:hypothetical protein
MIADPASPNLVFRSDSGACSFESSGDNLPSRQAKPGYPTYNRFIFR